MKSKHQQIGVNLVELMVGISIAALSLAVGVPSFESLRTRSDRSSAMIELISAARLARSEAALRGSVYTLCASADGTTCSRSADWSTGWIVFADPDANGAVANQTDVVKVVTFVNPQFTLTADNDIGGSITFGTFGYATPSYGQLKYMDHQTTRLVQLNYIGRLHVNKTRVKEEPS